MITVYLKPTNFCNVGCTHCYLPETVRTNKEKMSDETLHKVMQFLKEMKETGKHNQIFFLWHGGEPLVLSPSYFWNAGKIINQYFKAEEIIEAVQTSLIPFKKDFVNLVKTRWRSEIGSSIDFNSRLIKGSNEEYQKLWMSKVDLARENDIFIIPGITPNKKDCYNANQIFHWLVERDFFYWSLDRYSNFNGNLPDFSTNAEHSKFLIDLFDLCVKYYEKHGYTPYIKPIGAAINGIIFDIPGDRWGGTCQSDFIVINPDGKLNNCPDKDSFEQSYGNLFQGFNSFQSSPIRKKWIRIQQVGHRINECFECENSNWCKSGCPITKNACEINGIKDECSGFKTFITHIRKFIEKSQENKNWALQYTKFSLMKNSVNLTNNFLVSN
jgi:radical SAM protein with 4Fe4S-binding SPASM domain